MKSHGQMTTYHNTLPIKLNKLTDDLVKINFLIKFLEPGSYNVRFDAEYKVLKTGIYDDYSMIKHSGIINFEVVMPFNIKYE